MVSHRGSIPWGRVGGFAGAEVGVFRTGTVVERVRMGEAWLQLARPASGLRRAADRGIMVSGVGGKLNRSIASQAYSRSLGQRARREPRE